MNGEEDMFSNNDDFNDMPIPVFETHQQPTMRNLTNGEQFFAHTVMEDSLPFPVLNRVTSTIKDNEMKEGNTKSSNIYRASTLTKHGPVSRSTINMTEFDKSDNTGDFKSKSSFDMDSHTGFSIQAKQLPSHISS